MPMQQLIDDFRRADNTDNWRHALQVAQLAVTQFPDNAHALALRARAHMKLSQTTECDRDMAEALRLDPRCALAIATQAARMGDEGQPREALALLNQAIDTLPGDASLYIARGWQHQESGLLQEAFTDFQQATTLNPLDMRGFVNAATVLGALGRPAEAAEFWHQGATACPDNGELAYSAGTALYFDKDYERAIVHLDRARRIIGERNDVQMNRAQTLQMLDRHQAAVDEWLQLYQREPEWDWVLQGLGYSFYQLGEHAHSLRYHQELDQISSNHEGTVKMGWLLFHDRKSPELIALVEPLAKAPDSRPEFGQMMGMSLRRQGKYPEALEWMERTVAAHEDYHYARGDLANLLSEIYGRHDEALKHIQVAIAQDPENDFYRRVHGEILERQKPHAPQKSGWLKRLFGG